MLKNVFRIWKNFGEGSPDPWAITASVVAEKNAIRVSGYVWRTVADLNCSTLTSKKKWRFRCSAPQKNHPRPAIVLAEHYRGRSCSAGPTLSRHGQNSKLIEFELRRDNLSPSGDDLTLRNARLSANRCRRQRRGVPSGARWYHVQINDDCVFVVPFKRVSEAPGPSGPVSMRPSYHQRHRSVDCRLSTTTGPDLAVMVFMDVSTS